MNWGQRLKRVFSIDIEACSQCGGNLRVIACIEEPALIRTILDHVHKRNDLSENSARGPPGERAAGSPEHVILPPLLLSEFTE